uniref:Uncharacterized protein n=1 Tax=Cacopsylla melanoneura TaxID=428564 RepID=A0A8D8QP61_9HEMI
MLNSLIEKKNQQILNRVALLCGKKEVQWIVGYQVRVVLHLVRPLSFSGCVETRNMLIINLIFKSTRERERRRKRRNSKNETQTLNINVRARTNDMRAKLRVQLLYLSMCSEYSR